MYLSKVWLSVCVVMLRRRRLVRTNIVLVNGVLFDKSIEMLHMLYVILYAAVLWVRFVLFF